MKRWTIRRHLAAFIAAICIFGVLGQAIFTQLSFRNGFASYIEAVHRPRLETVAAQLGEHYHPSLGWRLVREDASIWFRITRELDDSRFESEEYVEEAPSPAFLDDVSSDDFSPGVPPLGGASDTELVLPDASQIYTETFSVPRGIELVLVDIGRGFVFGNVNVLEYKDLLELEIYVDNEVVGYLYSPGGMRIADAIDDAFSDELRRQSVWIGFCIALLSVVAAVVIAKQFSRPVTRLNNGADQLMSGNYDTQIPTDGPLEFGLLEQKFNRLADTLAANRTSQQHWIANISHELRTPLAVLHAELDALDSGVRTMGPAQLRSLLEECQRLSRLVDDLFFLSRSDSGDLSYEFADIDFCAVVQDVADEFCEIVKNAGLELEVMLPDREVTLKADVGRIRQLLGNLISNSCAYTDAGGKIILRLAADRKQLFVDVEDSTPGVASEEREKIFELLYRVEKSRNRSEGGAGLGLAICIAIAEAHGAKIEAFESDLGGLKTRVSFKTQ